MRSLIPTIHIVARKRHESVAEKGGEYAAATTGGPVPRQVALGPTMETTVDALLRRVSPTTISPWGWAGRHDNPAILAEDHGVSFRRPWED